MSRARKAVFALLLVVGLLTMLAIITAPTSTNHSTLTGGDQDVSTTTVTKPKNNDLIGNSEVSTMTQDNHKDRVVSNGASSHSVTSHVTNTSIGGQSQTSVVVNGKHLPVPQNGEVHQTLGGAGGTTQVDISSGTDTQSTNSSTSSSVTVNITSENTP